MHHYKWGTSSVLMKGMEMLCRWRELGIRLGAPIMSDFKRKCQLILSSGFCIPEQLTMHTGTNRRQVHPIFRFPSGNLSCVETLGEPRQRYQALNHMCNQSKLMARRQVRVTWWPGSLKAHDVQPVPSFCHSAKLSVCVSQDICSVSLIYCCLSSYTSIQNSSMTKATFKTNKGKSRSRCRLCVPPCPCYIPSRDTYSLCVVLLWVKHAQSALERASLRGGSLLKCSSQCWPRFRRGGAAAAFVEFAVGSSGGNADGRVPIFFLTC